MAGEDGGEQEVEQEDGELHDAQEGGEGGAGREVSLLLRGPPSLHLD